QENYKRFACTRCEFSITKIPGGRQLDVEEAEQLLRERTIGPLQGFRSRLGRPFAAILKLNDENRLEFDFGQSDADDDQAEPIDFSGREPLGKCPKCSGRIFEHGMNYVCENAVGAGKRCDFRSGKVILQQEVAPAQMRKLLAEGRTDLLTDFVSARTRRKFKAYLVLGPDGKVGFAFEPRAPKAAAKTAAKSAKAAGARGRSNGSSESGEAAEAAESVAAEANGQDAANGAATSVAVAAQPIAQSTRAAKSA